METETNNCKNIYRNNNNMNNGNNDNIKIKAENVNM